VTAIGLCVVAFVVCYWAGRRSLGQGLVALLAFGYAYGLVRANLLTTFSHFIFDAGLVGLYLSPKWRTVSPNEQKRSAPVKPWTFLLIAWPCLLLLIPIQPYLVQVVGLRGCAFFVPLLLLGSRLKGKDILELAAGLALLDIVALGFAGAEYVLGVPRFYPYSAVTEIMYMSTDVEGGYMRIPATFTSAHAFGGTMIGSIPFLLALWTTAQSKMLRLLGLLAIPAALVGVLMSATRSNFIFACLMMMFVFFRVRLSVKQRILILVVVAAVAVAALRNARLQRFKTLDDTEYVSNRLAGSVNRGFFEILIDYPLGNGLGGGGTSMPYFLRGQVRNPIGLENEYSRLLSEQGIIGFLLWIGFLGWYFSRSKIAFTKGPLTTPRILLWFFVATTFGTAWIGTGTLTAIPQTVLLMIAAGWTVVLPEALPWFRPPQRMPQRVAAYREAPAPVLR
jgi:hypothetical protein